MKLAFTLLMFLYSQIVSSVHPEPIIEFIVFTIISLFVVSELFEEVIHIIHISSSE